MCVSVQRTIVNVARSRPLPAGLRSRSRKQTWVTKLYIEYQLVFSGANWSGSCLLHKTLPREWWCETVRSVSSAPAGNCNTEPHHVVRWCSLENCVAGSPDAYSMYCWFVCHCHPVEVCEMVCKLKRWPSAMQLRTEENICVALD